MPERPNWQGNRVQHAGIEVLQGQRSSMQDGIGGAESSFDRNEAEAVNTANRKRFIL